jgi:RNA polymerase sigma factor (sigma-70 family)
MTDASLALRRVDAPADVADGGSVARPDLDTADLYARYARSVARRVRQFYGAGEVEEVVAEVFLKVVQRAHTFRGDCHPYTWLYAMTTNHCLTRLRQARRREALLASEGTLAWQPEITTGAAEAKVFLAEL